MCTQVRYNLVSGGVVIARDDDEQEVMDGRNRKKLRSWELIPLLGQGLFSASVQDLQLGSAINFSIRAA